jgi:CheY-like chemotaxis protein
MEALKELKNCLDHYGLLDKARELYTELDAKAALVYLKSSYRHLSKVVHPDVNPLNAKKATKIQQSLNRLGKLLSVTDDEEIIGLIKDGINEESSSGKKRILVVEDEFGLQELLTTALRLEGYDVRTAVDGDRGYDAYCQFEPDLVLTDVVMPGMNGLELVAKIRETNPHIKVIYVSGFFGIKRVKAKLDEELMVYRYPHLAKPFRLSELFELVKEYLEQ